MKKILPFFLYLLLILTSTVRAQKNTTNYLQRNGTASTQSMSGLLREGFENLTFPPTGWQTVNVAGPQVWQRSTMLPHTGLASAFCLYEQATSYGEDWLIMPKFNVVATDSLSFWFGVTATGFADSTYVLISVTDSALTSFTTKVLVMSDGNGYPSVANTFVQKNISLASFAGQSIYIAFRNWNVNGDGVSIDDVQLGTPSAKDVAAISWNKPHILGDTAQTPVGTVKNVGTATQTFNVTMTITGGYTSTQTVSSLAPNASRQISFSTWTPSVMGANIVKMYTQLAGDAYPQNDTLTDTLHISHIYNDDIKMLSIDMPAKTGNQAQIPKATLRNNGFNTETFNVTMTISGGYTSTATVTTLAPFTTKQVSFASWTPSVIGNNNIKVYAQLATDGDRTNDTLKNTIQVFQEFVNYGWQSKAPMPNKYFGNSSAFYHKGVYPNDTSLIFSLCGVDSNNTFSNENNAYSSVTNSWVPVLQAPLSRYEGSAQTVNSKIYFMGGFNSGFATVRRNDIYDIATNTWSVGSNMPQSVGDFASAVYKDSLIYIIGGWDSTGAGTNNVHIYNTYTNTWTSGTAKTGVATYGIRCGIYHNKIVAVGGSDGTSPRTDATLGVINPASPNTITWSALPNYPGFHVLRHSGSSVYKDQLPLIIFTSGDTAGYSNAGVTYFTNETWAYDLSSSSWKIGPVKITGTNDNNNLLGVVFNDSLYMVSVGGHDSTKPLNVNEWLNLGPDTTHILGINAVKLADNGAGVYPNPFSDKTSIALTLTKEQKVNVSVFDIHGRFVTELANKNFTEGNHTLTWNASNASSGVYMVRVVIGNMVMNKKLIKN